LAEYLGKGVVFLIAGGWENLQNQYRFIARIFPEDYVLSSFGMEERFCCRVGAGFILKKASFIGGLIPFNK
jgi:hypothetical protein